MKQVKIFITPGVNILTLFILLTGTGCVYVNRQFGESCKTHAYAQTTIGDYITTRFQSKAPARMAIIPFAVPANLAGESDELPGLGLQVAWKIQSRFMKSGEVPIVEVLNRPDWPGKKDEFFSGSFGAISMARQAGYDLLMVGYLEPINSANTFKSYTRVIDTESGITIWSGETEAKTKKNQLHNLKSTFWLEDKVPSTVYYRDMIDKLAVCIEHDVTTDPPVEDDESVMARMRSILP